MHPILIALEVVCVFASLTYLVKAESLRRQAGELARLLGEQEG